MQFSELRAALPEALVRDFASDPLAPFDKLLKKSGDAAWSLFAQMEQLLGRLPPEAIDQAFVDASFVALYGKNDRLARVWIAERLLIEESARRRLECLCSPVSHETAPYSLDCLQDIQVDDEGMVRLVNFAYNQATLARDRFSFTLCSTTDCPNSTYWLLRSFWEAGVADHVSVRLDPFLWGSSDSYPQTMYKMLMYATPVNWEDMGNLRETAHGRFQADKSPDKSELTEFAWSPRDDGVHFICEELPPKERIGFVAARYLHAIYDPPSESITHFDGALRIYTGEQLDERHRAHVRNSGKTGTRRKIFRIDAPISRNAFSLIAQAFFVWNRDLATYFRESLTG